MLLPRRNVCRDAAALQVRPVRVQRLDRLQLRSIVGQQERDTVWGLSFHHSHEKRVPVRWLQRHAGRQLQCGGHVQ